VDPAVRPRRSIFVQSAVMKGDFYLLMEEQTFRLGDVEQLIWKLANGQNDLDTIAKQISSSFDVAFDVAFADLTDFVTAAQDAGLLTFGAASGKTPGHPEAGRA
jgi:hypothetical protein